MKLFAILVLTVAAASASVLPSNMAELEQMLSAINDPNADPITVAALKDILEGYLGHYLTPDIGTPIVNPVPAPILGPGFEIVNPAPGPAPILGPGFEIISPVPEPEPVVVPAPAPVDQPAAASAPLVQLVVNVNAA